MSYATSHNNSKGKTNVIVINFITVWLVGPGYDCVGVSYDYVGVSYVEGEDKHDSIYQEE